MRSRFAAAAAAVVLAVLSDIMILYKQVKTRIVIYVHAAPSGTVCFLIFSSCRSKSRNLKYAAAAPGVIAFDIIRVVYMYECTAQDNVCSVIITELLRYVIRLT